MMRVVIIICRRINTSVQKSPILVLSMILHIFINPETLRKSCLLYKTDGLIFSRSLHKKGQASII
jgi:hypothetical protein